MKLTVCELVSPFDHVLDEGLNEKNETPLGAAPNGSTLKLAVREPESVHVESEITKGKYADYDSFLGEEAVEYLRLYLDARHQGNIHPEIPAEQISEDSPLIRDEMYEVARPIGEKQVRKLIHGLYFKAGLLKQKNGGRYALCVHSLRKFFKTQLMALGVQPDYIDYMMGHTVSTYHDIQSRGVEFLRGIYANAELHIRPKASLLPRNN